MLSWICWGNIIKNNTSVSPETLSTKVEENKTILLLKKHQSKGIYASVNSLRDGKDRKEISSFYIAKQIQPITYMISRYAITILQKDLTTPVVTQVILDSPGNWDGHLCLLIGFTRRKNKHTYMTWGSFATWKLGQWS